MKTWTKKSLLNEREKIARKKFTGILRAVLHPGPCAILLNDTFVGLIPMQRAG